MNFWRPPKIHVDREGGYLPSSIYLCISFWRPPEIHLDEKRGLLPGSKKIHSNYVFHEDLLTVN